MREIIKPALVLFAVCAITTIALAGIKAATQSTIDNRVAAELEQAKKEVLPQAVSFKELPASSLEKVRSVAGKNDYLATIQNVYLGLDASGTFIGSVYGAKSRGYDAAGVKMTIGIDKPKK